MSLLNGTNVIATTAPTTMTSVRASMRLRINHRLDAMNGAGLADMNGGDVVGIYLLPPIHMIEQLGRGTLRPHQRRLDLVLVQQAKQIARLHQSAGGVVIDHEFFAEQFGSPVDEGGDAIGDEEAAKIVIVETAGEIIFL